MNLNRHKSFLIGNYASPPIEIVRGKGTKLWDSDGQEYLDFTSGIAVTNLGHSHPHWVKKIQEQSNTLTHCSNLFSIPEQVSLAERLVQKIGDGKILFCNSGAEANEALIKLSRLYGNQENSQKTKILVASNGFHGRTMGALSATQSNKYRQGFEPLLPGFCFCEFNNVADFENAVDDQTAAILIESIQGEGGLHTATDEFLRGIEKLCRKYELLLLMDEVQAGIARTGEFLGYQKSGIQPDAIAMAKGLGGGFPIGAVLMNKKVASSMTPGTHGSTFGGNPLAMSVGNTVMDIVSSKKFLNNVKKSSIYFLSNLNKIKKKYPSVIKQIRGRGFLIGIQLHQDQTNFIKKLMENKLLTIRAAENVVRVLPPLNVKKSELDEALKIINKVCSQFK